MPWINENLYHWKNENLYHCTTKHYHRQEDHHHYHSQNRFHTCHRCHIIIIKRSCNSPAFPRRTHDFSNGQMPQLFLQSELHHTDWWSSDQRKSSLSSSSSSSSHQAGRSSRRVFAKTRTAPNTDWWWWGGQQDPCGAVFGAKSGQRHPFQLNYSPQMGTSQRSVSIVFPVSFFLNAQYRYQIQSQYKCLIWTIAYIALYSFFYKSFSLTLVWCSYRSLSSTKRPDSASSDNLYHQTTWR